MTGLNCGWPMPHLRHADCDGTPTPAARPRRDTSQPEGDDMSESERVMRDLALSFADTVEEGDPDGSGNLLAVGLRHAAEDFAAFAAAFHREATAPAPDVEVREEWGVRRDGQDHGPVFDEEAARLDVQYLAELQGVHAVTLRRTVTTSAWEVADRGE